MAQLWKKLEQLWKPLSKSKKQETMPEQRQKRQTACLYSHAYGCSQCRWTVNGCRTCNPEWIQRKFNRH